MNIFEITAKELVKSQIFSTFVAVKLRENRSDEFFAPRKMALNGIRAYALNDI